MYPKKEERNKLVKNTKKLYKMYNSYCYSYDWEFKEAVAYEKVDYAEELQNICDVNFIIFK